MDITFSEKKHVLALSNEPRVLAEIKMELMEKYEVSIAATSAAAISVLETYKTSVILIHIGENSEDAFSLFSDISEFAKSRHISVMFVAEKGNDNDEMKAFMLGAVDYTVRRRGTVDALKSRIGLRIRANENEKHTADEEPPPDLGREADPVEKTVLVVDDIVLNREIVAGILADVGGLTLDFAGDGREAVTKFAKSPYRYSLILMDVHMPVMSGIEATKKIRSMDHERAREIPIVALTASITEEETGICFTSGMNDYISKPVDYAELINIIAEYCYQGRLR